MRAATFLATCVALAGPVPAGAQTFEEAVRANLSLGLRLCLAGGSDMAAWAQGFRNAGYAERIEASGGDTTHFFSAPAETAEVELYYGQMPEHCIVSTTHLGVTDAAAVLDQVVPALYPGYVRKVTQGAVNPATGQPAQCVRYEDPANPIGHVIGVLPKDTGTDCTDNGTSQFYSSYRV